MREHRRNKTGHGEREREMSRRWVFLVHLLVHTVPGSAVNEVQVSYSRDHAGLQITCHLREEGNGTLTQVNWVLSHGPSNQTRLGTYHPEHGTHVPPEQAERIRIQGSVPGRSSTLVLIGGDVEEGSSLCCILNTFPNGVFERCADTSAIAAAQEVLRFSGSQDESEIREGKRWGLLIGGAVACVLSIIIYLVCMWCYRLCCRRRRVFEVHTHLTDQHAQPEYVPEEYPQVSLPPPSPPYLPSTPPEPQGFDPSKLYAKIRLDLLYGRLWKAYQGRSQAWSPKPPGPDAQQDLTPAQPIPDRVYSLLGQAGTGASVDPPNDPSAEPRGHHGPSDPS